jgi:glucokinase
MSLLGIDLGGTKIAFMLLTEEGKLLTHQKVLLGTRTGKEVGSAITDAISELREYAGLQADPVRAIGVSVPGIYHSKTGTVWAPNIEGWEAYPLLSEITTITGNLPVSIDSDRACYILGELWQGNAQGSRDAIFLAVGTGIGAGILVDGQILRGAHDIGGAIGWMALAPPHTHDFSVCGCFEYHASGKGLAQLAQHYATLEPGYNGALLPNNGVTASDVFTAFFQQDHVAERVIHQCIQFWGMAIANLVSLFNPEKIILGGGVFGPGLALLEEIKGEVLKWAQPISVQNYTLEGSALGGDAGAYGAGFLALKNILR